MPSSKPVTRLRDVVENCTRILDYTAGMTRDDYARDHRTCRPS